MKIEQVKYQRYRIGHSKFLCKYITICSNIELSISRKSMGKFWRSFRFFFMIYIEFIYLSKNVDVRINARRRKYITKIKLVQIP